LVEKFPTVLEKLPQVLRGDFFHSHCIIAKEVVYILFLMFMLMLLLLVKLKLLMLCGEL